MNKEYVVSVDSMVAIRADSAEEAIEIARQDFVEMLQKDNAELVVVEEWSDDSYSEEMQSDLEPIDE
mgnify:CR=1 FL=1|tara:strand:- start:387 stop:587 length:201 start_codon:yes stop_codon:yes gene_type:complete